MRLKALKAFGPKTSSFLKEGLSDIAGIERVEANGRIGSLTIYYSVQDSLEAASAYLAAAEEQRESRVPAQKPLESSGKPSLFPFIRYFLIRPLLPMPVRVASAAAGAIPFIRRGAASLAHARLDVEALDGTAVAISLLRRDFGTAGLLTLLLNFGDQLERYTQKRSVENLASHLAVRADKAWVSRGGEEMLIPLRDLTEEDLVIVRSGNAIPVDGVVAEGTATVNESSMTGEPLGVMRSEGASVYAGTVVEEGEIRIRPTGIGKNSRIQQLIDYIEASELMNAGIRSRFERMADKAVPFTFGLAALVLLLTGNTTRAASVLLVDYSCALRLATPLAILSGMNEGIKRSVLVKGGLFLEKLSQADTVVFDKTGTLTQSQPSVAEIVPVPGTGLDEDEILRLAACLEEHFPHPVAKMLVKSAEDRGLRHAEEHTEVEYVVAHGVASRWRGRHVVLGSRHFVSQDEGVDISPMEPEVERLSAEGYSLLYLGIDGKLAGIVAMVDPLRPESAALIRRLAKLGISHVMMLTGDDERTARAVAGKLGITEYRSQVLPEDKAETVRGLKEEGRTVLMLGDGINDSPALSSADIGVTLRDGADLAREVADVVLMGRDLEGLATAIELGRGSMRRIMLDYKATMILNSLFLAGGLFGILTPGLSAVLHNVTTLGVCLNAMRPVLGRER